MPEKPENINESLEKRNRKEGTKSEENNQDPVQKMTIERRKW